MEDKNKKVIPTYITKPSNDFDLFKCEVIKAHCFADSIEATGISYKSRVKTLKDLEAEKLYIQEHFDNLNMEVIKGLTARERLKQINLQILKRKRMYRNCGKGKGKSKTKADNIKSVNRSKKRMTRLVKKNFPFALCATMTYEEPEFDLRKVQQKDFPRFIDRLRYRFPNIVYLAVYEPHEKRKLAYTYDLQKCQRTFKRRFRENLGTWFLLYRGI